MSELEKTHISELGTFDFSYLENPDRDGIGSSREIPLVEKMDAATGIDWSISPDIVPDPKKYRAYGGPNSYVISHITTGDKKSEGFSTCMGLLITGRTAAEERLSCMVHAYPTFVFATNKPDEKFQRDLRAVFEEFREVALPCTIDAAIFGGRYPLEPTDSSATRRDIEHQRYNYIRMVEFLSQTAQEVLGFDPLARDPNELMSLTTSAYYLVAEDQRGSLHTVRAQLDLPGGAKQPSRLLISYSASKAREVLGALNR